ncbi:Hint domain-containing protein [Antarctobacter jejuensis]|uniref:Hint domain-containing protein n=1 Tax=Antarctobacter jejuensis TaxID=1439938 RepID=UPI003FD4B467
MSWIAISGEGLGWSDPVRVGQDQPDALLPRGTLMVETALGVADRPQRLLTLERDYPWRGSLSLSWLPGGSVALVVTQGDRILNAVLPLQIEMREDVLRISYAWNAPAQAGRLAVERADGTVLAWIMTDAPPPMALSDATALAWTTPGAGMFVALSDVVEPIGPVPALAADVPVETPFGPRAVSELRCGDTVVTRGGAVVPVLARITRRVPALGGFRPVRLFAPYFGLTGDLVVAPEQGLVIGGADVSYLFGCEAVLVRAGSLVNGVAAAHEDCGPLIDWHHVLLPGHEPLCAVGAELESLYMGRMRRRRDLLAQTQLAEVPGGLLPEHGGTALKVLRPFEAVVLAEARAA